MAEFLTTEIADRHVPAFRRGFVAAIEAAKKSVSLAKMEDGLRRIQDPGIDWAEFQQTLAEHVIPLIEKVVKASAEAHVPPNVKKQKTEVAPFPEPLHAPTYGFSFNITNPEAVNWIRAHAGELITDVTNETRMAIRALVQRSFQEGIPPRKLARMVREHIGLTRVHSIAAFNYEAGLTESVTSEAITAERAATLGNRYHDRLLRYRANNIARTETITASCEGQSQLWSQMEGEGFLDKDDGYKAWLVTNDEKLCRWCAPIPTMNGPIPRNEEFQTPRGPRMKPPAHPSCRCSWRLHFKDKSGKLPPPPAMPTGWKQSASGAWVPPKVVKPRRLKPRVTPGRVARVAHPLQPKLGTAPSIEQKFISGVDVDSNVAARRAGSEMAANLDRLGITDWDKAGTTPKKVASNWARIFRKGEAFDGVDSGNAARVRLAMDQNAASPRFRRAVHKYTDGKDVVVHRGPIAELTEGTREGAKRMGGASHVLDHKLNNWGTHTKIPRPGTAGSYDRSGLAGTLRHEYGHDVWDVVRATQPDLHSQWNRAYRSLRPEISDKLTRYAATSEMEGFCEAFSLYTDNKFDVTKFPGMDELWQIMKQIVP